MYVCIYIYIYVYIYIQGISTNGALLKQASQKKKKTYEKRKSFISKHGCFQARLPHGPVVSESYPVPISPCSHFCVAIVQSFLWAYPIKKRETSV